MKHLHLLSKRLGLRAGGVVLWVGLLERQMVWSGAWGGACSEANGFEWGLGWGFKHLHLLGKRYRSEVGGEVLRVGRGA